MPGISARPPASMACRAPDVVLPITLTRPASTAMLTCFGGLTKPSNTSAPRIKRSCMRNPWVILIGESPEKDSPSALASNRRSRALADPFLHRIHGIVESKRVPETASFRRIHHWTRFPDLALGSRCYYSLSGSVSLTRRLRGLQKKDKSG